MKSKILITGGCGKIGSYFVKFAWEKYFVRVVDKIPWDIKNHGALLDESMVIDLQYLADLFFVCLRVLLHFLPCQHLAYL